MKKIILVLAAALVLFLPAARADGSDNTFFEWTFTNLTFIGDNACGANGSGVGSSPCVETFNGSFEVEVIPSQLLFGIVGTGSVTSTGPLTGFGCCSGPQFEETNFVWMDGNGTEIDFAPITAIKGVPLPPGTYQAFGVIFTCPAGPCANDFFSGVPQVENNLDPPFATGTITVKEIPEPPMLAMMLAGLLSLAFLKRGMRFSLRAF
jgi:hypothetical protein